MTLCYDPEGLPRAALDILEALGEEYPLRPDRARANLTVRLEGEAGRLRVVREGDRFRVAAGSPAGVGRGIAYALAGREADESRFLRTFGILFDCTRGNVVTVERFRHWLRRLSLLGYDTAMLYVKDAYVLPGEPYFGHMRGAYTLAEVQEVDRYARRLGIEMIASIQALGHLEPILRWPAYERIRDTPSVLLVDEPESYRLLDKILDFWSAALSSRRIHLGMDETHDLGRGRRLDESGYESPFDLYNRHLERVCGMCRRRGLRPIIWADMFFRYANPRQEYYDQAARVPEEVRRAIPRDVQLSYWDYYHRDAGTYESMLRRTSALNGSEPFMASGVWTWPNFWTDYEQTRATVSPCLEACRRAGARELVLAMWGDDGGFCDFDSAFAGLAWAADLAANPEADEGRIAALFQAVCRTDYARQIRCGDLCYTFEDPLHGREVAKVLPASLLWDDPLLGIVRQELKAYPADLPERLKRNFLEIMHDIGPHREDRNAGHLDYAWNVARTLALKLDLRLRLEDAYAAGDSEALRDLAERSVPEVVAALEDLVESHRRQWNRSFKPFGLEIFQIRIGGQIQRHQELARTIQEFLRGEVDRIAPLDSAIPVRGDLPHTYLRCATGCFFI